ncbi:mechanosensitive ion channel [soil metagenome]
MNLREALGDELWIWCGPVGASVIGGLIAMLAYQILVRVVSRAFRRSDGALHVIAAGRSAVSVLLPLIALQLVWAGASDKLPSIATIRHGLTVLLLACLTWLAARCIHGIYLAVAAAHPTSIVDNLQARRLQTQARVLSRVASAGVVLVGASLILMTFPEVRQIGQSLLASAGLVGIVAGFAAKPVLGNLIAGLQIGLTQPIRLDDVVVVEGEWGWIEEITGAYVVVRIWDQRRLVVPLQWWVEHPFQNWTRSSADLLGTVFLWVDYRMPLQPLRDELDRLCRSTPLWDGRVSLLQVTEAGEHAMQLRCLVTSADSPKNWDLRCLVREGLVQFIQREFPEHLPTFRAALTSPATDPASLQSQARQ